MSRSKLCPFLLLLTFLVVFILQPAIVAQTPIKADWRCSFDGRHSQARVFFPSGALAQVAVSTIIKYTGLVQNFVVAEANIPNAEAFVNNEKRVILYNPQFIQRIVNSSSTDWAATGILAHEIGHHLLGHTIQSRVDPKMELDADRFAGFVLQKMGASIIQAQAGWKDLSATASVTHPGREDRLRAVREGWTAARDLRPLSSAPATRYSIPKSRPNEIWFTTMSRTYDHAQRYNVVNSLPKNEFIRANWVEDYYITSVARGNNRWVVIMDQNPRYTNQYFKVSSIFPASWIKEMWDKGYRITAVSYGQPSWVVVMTKGTGYTEESYRISASFPVAWVKEKWDKGLRITSMAMGDNQYAVVMSKGSGRTAQEYKTTEMIDADWIKAKWAEGYYITSTVYNGKFWTVVMSKGTNFTHQWYWLTKDFPSAWITERWKNGYDITLMF
jgi:hypothetical protein